VYSVHDQTIAHCKEKIQNIWNVLHRQRTYKNTMQHSTNSCRQTLRKRDFFSHIWVPLVMFYATLNLRNGFCASQVYLRRTFCASKPKKGSTSRICLAQVQKLIPSCAKSRLTSENLYHKRTQKNRTHSFGPIFDPKSSMWYCTFHLGSTDMSVMAF